MTAAEAREVPCPGCGALGASPSWRVRDRLFATTDRTFRLWRCDDCELLFLWPVPPWSELEGYYPSGYWPGTTESPGWHARLREGYRRWVLRDHLRFLGPIVERQRDEGRWRRLLDVGCGDGAVLQAMAVPESIGMDTSLEAVRFVRSRGLSAVCGALPDAPFPAGSFSLVVMLHVLEHVCPAGPHLKAIRELLAPGGELVVQVPNAGGLGAWLLGRHWAGLDPPRHLVNYSLKTLVPTLERHGFRVLEVGHRCGRDNPATLVNSLFPGLYPPARAIRHRFRSGRAAWLGDLGYLALTLLASPGAWLGSALGRGESVMVRCRRRERGEPG